MYNLGNQNVAGMDQKCTKYANTAIRGVWPSSFFVALYVQPEIRNFQKKCWPLDNAPLRSYVGQRPTAKLRGCRETLNLNILNTSHPGINVYWGNQNAAGMEWKGTEYANTAIKGVWPPSFS